MEEKGGLFLKEGREGKAKAVELVWERGRNKLIYKNIR